MKPIEGSDSPPNAKELSAGKYRVVETIGYRCTSCNKTFDLVVAQTPVERIFDLEAAAQLEALEKDYKNAKNAEIGIREGIGMYLKAMRFLRRVDRQQTTITGGIKRLAGRAWTRLSVCCPNCKGRRLNKIKYSERGVNIEDTGTLSEDWRPGSTFPRR